MDKNSRAESAAGRVQNDVTMFETKAAGGKINAAGSLYAYFFFELSSGKSQ